MFVDALVSLGHWLRAEGYVFTTVTPATHTRVNARTGNETARDLRGIFGWSRPFAPQLLPASLRKVLVDARLLVPDTAGLRSTVRFSSLAGQLFAHTAFPTRSADAVFFGPDTVRFANLIDTTLREQPLLKGACILDVGCGAGPGGIVAALRTPAAAPRLVLADINPRALEFARANAVLASLPEALCVEGDLYAASDGRFDLIVANPPYLVDPAERTYRHGGGPLGASLSLRIVAEGLPRLAPGGRLVLYTGAAVVEGADALHDALAQLLDGWVGSLSYSELDPDVFGEELDAPAYRAVERIAAVALVVQAAA